MHKKMFCDLHLTTAKEGIRGRVIPSANSITCALTQQEKPDVQGQIFCFWVPLKKSLRGPHAPDPTH